MRVITKTKFVEIVVVAAEIFLIIIYFLQNKESKKQLFGVYLPVKLIN